MCGISGIFAYHPAASSVNRAELTTIRDAMISRGPDGAGIWLAERGRLGLAHRRLSIIDLSERAAQPMHSHCGRFHVTFNGEIYNFPDIRQQLEAQGRCFQSNSDTEILLHLYDLKGEDMVADLRGMFAFAIWDSVKQELFLARDPYGIKPLYYADDGRTLRFASQVKAILAGTQVSRDPESAGLIGFYLWGSVPDPFTLYRDIRAVPAGCSLKVTAAGPNVPRSYTKIADLFAAGAANPSSSVDVAQRVRDAACESVGAHLLADVEVGLFLSAGVDSGALLGLMRDAGAEKIKAITLAFSEFRGTAEDETPLARKIAETYDAEHVVRVVDEAEFRDDLPRILDAMDQPSIDGVNTWFVAKAAREAGLKVALSGVGGDELFAGYPSFHSIPLWVRMLRIPAVVPGIGSGLRRAMGITGLGATRPKLPGILEYGGTYTGAYLLHRGLFMPWELGDVLGDPALAADGLRRLAPLARLSTETSPTSASPCSRVATLESVQYMRNQLLRDADWAGMAHSLEIRTPLVDIELLRQLSPVTAVLKGRQGKQALGMAPRSPLPEKVTSRAKTGFGVPTGKWLAKQVGKQRVEYSTKGSASRIWGRYILSLQDVSDARKRKPVLGGA